MDSAPDQSAQQLEVQAATHYGAGDYEAAVAAWEQIHAVHVRCGEHVRAARAAAMIALYLMMDTGLMAPVRGWLDRSERLLADADDTPVHALIAMVRGYERFFCGDRVLAKQWAARAITLGERHNVVPAVILGRVASARLKILDGHVDEGLAALDQVASVLMSGEVDALTTGIMFCELVCAVQGLAQYDKAEEWTAAMDAIRQRGVFFGGVNGRCRVHRAEILRLRGSCAEAEDEALHACEELRPWLRREFGWPLTELGTIRLRRGDLAGAEEAFLAAHANGWDPQPGLAQLRFAQGDPAGAAILIADALDHPRQIPSKERPPAGGLSRAPLLDAQVEIALAAGDIDAARQAAEELGQIAALYHSRALAAGAALARGRVALCTDQFATAVVACRVAVDEWCTVGAPYEASVARIVLAHALAAAGDTVLARTETDVAAAALAAMGAVSLSPAPALGGELNSTSSAPVAAETTPAIFRRDGDTRRIQFSGQTVLLRDLKGMRYLARLLAEPGREFHALDLLGVEHQTLPTAGRGAEMGALDIGNDDAGPLLDDQARQAYRRRLAEIEQDIDEAHALGDAPRVALATADRDFIIAELSRAFGLGGRHRAAASTSERARGSVTRSVRYALAKIAEGHSPLADHLAHSVRTGTYCTYAPDPRAPITWEV